MTRPPEVDGEWEFEIHKKNREYEVDATTGKISSFEQDDGDD